MTPHLIGLVGYAQVGKSTSARHLAANYGYTEVAFADPLRQLAEHLDPIVSGRGQVNTYREALAQFGYEGAKAEVPGFRDYLKKLGNGVRALLGDHVWVDAALAKAKGQDSVISDVRFLNEGAAIRRVGGKVIRIVRPGFNAESDFEREVPVVQSDYTVVNDGSLGQLCRELDRAMSELSLKSEGVQVVLPL